MKKLITLILAVLMIASLSVTAFAVEKTEVSKDWYSDGDGANFTGNTTTDSGEVWIEAGTPPAGKVYHVTVDWKALYFQFGFTQNYKWDPQKHDYVVIDQNGDKGTWAAWNGTEYVTVTQGDPIISNAIVVENHSNDGVNLDVYCSEATDNDKTQYTYNKVTAKVALSGGKSSTLATAEGVINGDTDNDNYQDGPTTSYDVSVSGTPSVNTNFKVGTIVVKIARATQINPDGNT